MKYVSGIMLSILMMNVVFATYTPSLRDRTVTEKIDTKLDTLAETGGKEYLVALFSRIVTLSHDIEDLHTLYLLEYILQVIATHLQTSFDVTLTWNHLTDDTMRVAVEKKISSDDNSAENKSTTSSTSSLLKADEATTYDLETFYQTYKGYVTSSEAISDLCTQWYDEMDAVAKEYNFPTALIIATRYKEHTCIFDNPANGRGNFQITSHYYPAGEITWERFENQIINFIVFSQAKRAYYDDVQTFGPDPITLTYDNIDLSSLRKHAIFYNGIKGELDTNLYANQNFGMQANGRDGIVAMTIRALGRQLHKDKTGVLMDTSLFDQQDKKNEAVVGEDTDEVVVDGDTPENPVKEPTKEENCEDRFTVDLGPDATNPAVLAMQQFLVDQGLYTGDPSGIYDEKTTQAVSAFQAYYKAEILDPGGYTAPTGYWYPATRRKANVLSCK